jgi:pyruvate-ferredoxin/flavodoxin oxidoreductase
MSNKHLVAMDGNEAVASVAYRTSEVIAIYPITPASSMGEHSDDWAHEARPNLWGSVPSVIEMQSEAGAAGAVHGALQAGSLATTFTASQGLLLMLPNMYKIAGELTPAVFHIAARSIATHALSIFGDHSDVMAARSTGWALLASTSVQQAMDFAAVAFLATLESRVPFLHFFDGFRTSHEIACVEPIDDATLRAMIPDELIQAHRRRALSPDHPVMRGTAQNPDVFFQARERANPFYGACAAFVENAMRRFASLTGRGYELFEYYGAKDADRVVVIMGSGAEAVKETIDHLSAGGEKVGVVVVQLYRPFDVRRFVGALPPTTRAIAVLDRTKEPGAIGEPLYLDVVAALREGVGALHPKVVGGRYGLSSKELTPGMIASVYRNLALDEPKNHFTVGIEDDVTHTSLAYDETLDIEGNDVARAIFYGLGSDGTVGANKSSIKIMAEETSLRAQGYFVYDSKKSGTMTVSHLRFSPRPIRSSYLVQEASFIACHHPSLLERADVLEHLAPGGTVLLDLPHRPDEVWSRLPKTVRAQLRNKQASLYTIDARRVAREGGLGTRVNTIMQACYFALASPVPKARALDAIRASIRKAYAKKGERVVEANLAVVDAALDHLTRIEIPALDQAERANGDADGNGHAASLPFLSEWSVCAEEILRGRGDRLPVSAMPIDGTFPTGTSKIEKRNLADQIPVWSPDFCIECGKCTFVCPHAAIRIKVYEPSLLAAAPPTFKATGARDRAWEGLKYTIQVAPEDCTGCTICVDVCPARDEATGVKALEMAPQPPLREEERKNWSFFLSLPELDRERIKTTSIRQQQVEQPLFEFSGACLGCGETPYLKLLSQLFGDRALIANATGCSSIFSGNLPTTPWTKNAEGRGPAWSNSLFEDNAEFGLGFRIAVDAQRDAALALLAKLEADLGPELTAQIRGANQESEAGIREQRRRVAALKGRLTPLASTNQDAARLLEIADLLVKKSVWIVGGDGWAYDIGFGGLDHVLSSGKNVNLLVLDTEVYSNTGGQRSKSTPLGAVAKFAAGGKRAAKKDLGLIAMSYENVYVASVALGAKDEHTLKAFLEAESYDGPSLIIAYSHCIAHGIEMSTALHDHKAAVDSGQWLLYRFDPRRREKGENPLVLDSKGPKIPLSEYLDLENRFRMLKLADPAGAAKLFEEAEVRAKRRLLFYERLSKLGV